MIKFKFLLGIMKDKLDFPLIKTKRSELKKEFYFSFEFSFL